MAAYNLITFINISFSFKNLFLLKKIEKSIIQKYKLILIYFKNNLENQLSKSANNLSNPTCNQKYKTNTNDIFTEVNLVAFFISDLATLSLGVNMIWDLEKCNLVKMA